MRISFTTVLGALCVVSPCLVPSGPVAAESNEQK
jgi:hypothetical protein